MIGTDLEDGGDFFYVFLRKEPKIDHFLVARREVLKDFLHLFLFKDLFGKPGRTLAFGWWIPFIGVEVGVHAGAGGAPMVGEGIGRGAVKPGADADPSPFVTREGFDKFQKGPLDKVFGGFFMSAALHEEAIELIGVQVVQLADGGRVGFGAENERLVSRDGRIGLGHIVHTNVRRWVR